jgi:MFS family permease
MCGSQALAQAAIVDISTEDNKAINLSLISLASCIGFVLGPTMAGLLSDKHLYSWFSFATPFCAAGGLAFLNVTCLLFTFKETFYPKAVQRLKLTKGLEVFISAFTNKMIRKIAAIFLIAEIGWALYMQFLPLYLIAGFHYSAAQIGHIMTWMGVVFVTTFLFIMRMATKIFKIEQIAYIALALTAIGVLLALTKTEVILWFSIIPAAVGGGLFYVAFITLFSNTVDENSQGWVMGIFAAVAAVSWSLGAGLSGVLGIVGLAVPFIAAAGFLLLGVIGKIL